MCCLFAVLVFLGPRAAILVWWLLQPLRWQLAYPVWVWPLLGFIFLPWVTLMYVLVAPGGIVGFDWIWLGLALIGDIAWWTGGGFRKRVPGYSGY
jgi:hypothetical protein